MKSYCCVVGVREPAVLFEKRTRMRGLAPTVSGAMTSTCSTATPAGSAVPGLRSRTTGSPILNRLVTTIVMSAVDAAPIDGRAGKTPVPQSVDFTVYFARTAGELGVVDRGGIVSFQIRQGEPAITGGRALFPVARVHSLHEADHQTLSRLDAM